MANITETRQASRFKELVSLGNIPIVVATLAGLSGYIVIEYGGYTGNEISGSLLALLDPTLYMVSLFLHEGWSEYVGSMYFFVPAGIILTYLTNNKNVLGVVVVSHVFAVLLSGISLGLPFAGTIAAAYGLLAATMVRATRFGTEKYSKKTQQAAPVCVLFIAVFGLLMLVTTIDQGSQYLPVLIGFIFGGAFEATRVYIETRSVGSKDEDTVAVSKNPKAAGGEDD